MLLNVLESDAGNDFTEVTLVIEVLKTIPTVIRVEEGFEVDCN